MQNLNIFITKHTLNIILFRVLGTGGNVLVSIPTVDKGPGNQRNIQGVVDL